MHGDYELQQIIKLWVTYTEHLLWESSSERSKSSCICVPLFWRPDIKVRNALCYFFIVVESHPDNMLEDLRLDKPFPELTEHVQDYDLEHMDKKVGMWFALCSPAQVQTQHRGSVETALGRWLWCQVSSEQNQLWNQSPGTIFASAPSVPIYLNLKQVRVLGSKGYYWTAWCFVRLNTPSQPPLEFGFLIFMVTYCCRALHCGCLCITWVPLQKLLENLAHLFLIKVIIIW